jgi:hypothetical protein
MSEAPNAVSIFGAVTGGLALTLSVLNFLRDGARVQVQLHWDFIEFGYGARPGKFTVVNVMNVGRRPVYLSHVHLSGIRHNSSALLPEGIGGVTLAEGSKPHSLTGKQDAELDVEPQ